MRRLIIILLLVASGCSLPGLNGQTRVGLQETQLRVRDIVIEGNEVTRERIIFRELVFARGDTIEKMELLPAFQRSRQNIMNLSLFNFVYLDAKHYPGNEIDVIITVQERWYIWPVPILEYADRNLSSFLESRDWGRINYGLWLKWNNFRGRNEMLTGKIRLGYKEQYALEYTIPNMGKRQNHWVTGGFNFDRQHEVNYKTFDNQPLYYKEYPEYANTRGNAYLSYTYRHKLYTYNKVILSYVNEWVRDTVRMLNPNFFGEGRDSMQYLKFSYEYMYDVRDSKVYPLEGFALKVRGEKYGLGLLKNYPYENALLYGTIFFHHKINNRFYFANATKGRYSLNKALPYSQMKALGYNEFMSGYEYYVIDGSDYFITKYLFKTELLKPRTYTIPFLKMKQFNKIHYAVYFNIFADAGFVYNEYPDPKNTMVNEWQFSVGLGLDLVTYYDQVLRMEYSVNRYGLHGLFFHLETPFYRW